MEPRLTSKAKSLFQSKTFWGAAITFWLAISPDLQAIANQNRLPTVSEWFHIVTIAIGTGATIYGRYSADTEVYTPPWMPGRNAPIDSPVQTEETNEPQ